jgi:hypothetical protein
MLDDRVRETTTTTGTGNITLAGAATGFISFNTAFGTNTPCAYYIASSGGTEWEAGIGHLSGSTTLVRDHILRSSTGSAVSFSAGTKDVFCEEPSAVRVTRGQVAAQIASRGLR